MPGNTGNVAGTGEPKMFRKKNTAGVNSDEIRAILDEKKAKMTLSLKACAHCSFCAESCFLFMGHNKDPKYMPSYKFLNSVGVLYKKKGNVDKQDLGEMRDLVWERCVLCTRCYCPIGIDIPDMLALARRICRSQGVYPQYDKE
jgi:Fe-S oxidoreductase